jgi:hypothetical protein
MKRILSVVVLASCCLASIQTTADVYFSPNGGCRDALLAQLRAAHHSIDAAIFSFTVDRIAAVLDSAAERGVEVRVVADKQQAGSSYSVVDALAKGIRVRIGAGSGLMHNKFAVIDDSICMTGSYNWSDGAEIRNDENLLVLVSPALAKAYGDQFETLWVHSVPESDLSARPDNGHTQSSPVGEGQPGAGPGSLGRSESVGSDQVYVTKSGKRYHRAGCSYLAKSCIPIDLSDAVNRGYTPCGTCRPAAVSSVGAAISPSSERRSTSVAPSSSESGGKYWINSGSGVRHNSRCRWYGNTKRGYFTNGEVGRPCGQCGG